MPNAYVVIASIATPVASGIVAFFYGPDAQARAVAYRDLNYPGFGVAPCSIPLVGIASITTVELP